jgi:hypothetical protein
MINSPLEDIKRLPCNWTQAERAKPERLLVSLDEDDEILAAWVEEVPSGAMQV